MTEMGGLEIALRVLGYLVTSVGFVGLRLWKHRKKIVLFDSFLGRMGTLGVALGYVTSIMWPILWLDLGAMWWAAGTALMVGTMMGLGRVPLTWLVVRLGY